ncbi:hypothetical protein CDD83_1021 [Cordyceps sp. RAO-2017]|nr:hypothetical protein CDD83_1021 [Cordyceps sp. RAO-2017]
MHLSYLSAAARPGDVVRVQADADRVGGSLAFVSVRIARVDEASGLETVVALGRHTKYVKGTAPAERG